eukprot:4788340-Pyramimonas_sp.AAC.1
MHHAWAGWIGPARQRKPSMASAVAREWTFPSQSQTPSGKISGTISGDASRMGHLAQCRSFRRWPYAPAM